MDFLIGGVIGFLASLGVNAVKEYYRKKSRIESLSSRIFDKRLLVHEELYLKVFGFANEFDQLCNNDQMNIEHKYENCIRASAVVAHFIDENQLYLREDLSAHVGIFVISAKSVFENDLSQDERQKWRDKFIEGFPESKELIKQASGVSKVEELFLEITNPKIESSTITEYLKLKEEFEENREGGA